MNIDGKKWFEINGLLLPNYLLISQFEKNTKGNGLYGTKKFHFLVHYNLHSPHCELWQLGLEESFHITCFKHVFSNTYQYATNNTKMCFS